MVTRAKRGPGSVDLSHHSTLLAVGEIAKRVSPNRVLMGCPLSSFPLYFHLENLTRARPLRGLAHSQQEAVVRQVDAPRRFAFLIRAHSLRDFANSQQDAVVRQVDAPRRFAWRS